MEKVDVIVVGQGIAGSLLAMELMKNGFSIRVFDDESKIKSSNAAAGLYNPITGRKMVKTWLADQLFPGLSDYYVSIEKKLESNFHHPIPIYRPFVSVEEQNDWLGNSASPQYQPFIREIKTESFQIHGIQDPYGGIVLERSGYIDLPTMLRSIKEFLKNKGLIRPELFEIEQMQIDNEGIKYGEIFAGKVIFCEGTHVIHNPLWSDLKFRPVKGEVMDILMQFDSNHIINRGVFMIPVNGIVRVGATYDNKNLDHEVTTRGLNILKEKLEKIFRGDYDIIRSWAGIRPATFDRRPYIGFHKKFERIGIFNGFGTKGVSLVPFFAKLFVENLLNKKELLPEVRLDR